MALDLRDSLLHRAAGEGLAETAHDVSLGGLAVSLAECAIAGGLGVDVKLDEAFRPDALLFGESPGRVVCAAPDAASLLAAAEALGVPARVIGRSGGDRVTIGNGSGEPWIDLAVSRLASVRDAAIPRRLEASDG